MVDTAPAQPSSGPAPYSTRVRQRHRPGTPPRSCHRTATCPNDRERPCRQEFASRGPIDDLRLRWPESGRPVRLPVCCGVAEMVAAVRSGIRAIDDDEGAAKSRQICFKCLIMPDTCPDRGSRQSFRRSGRYSRRSVKPLARPTVGSDQTFAASPPLLARRKAARSKPRCPCWRSADKSLPM